VRRANHALENPKISRRRNNKITPVFCLVSSRDKWI
jgi:hypothetical protein